MRSTILKVCLYSLFFVSPVLGYCQINARSSEKNILTDAQSGAQVFKANRALNDQTEIVEVVGIGLPVVTASNIADGTEMSYYHQLRIAYPLSVINGKNNFQLVFYGENDKIPYAVNTDGAATIIYLPITIHEYFKAKLDQAFAARKKVQLKLNVLASGLREAVWVL